MPYRQTPISRSRNVIALDFIRRYFIKHGSSPSFSEIGSALGMSNNHVGRLIRELCEDGLISFTPGRPRSIVLPELIGNHSTDQILLELMRRGWVMNPGKLLEPIADVTKCGVPLDTLIADIDRVTGETDHGQGDSGEAGIEEDQAGHSDGAGREAEKCGSCRPSLDCHCDRAT